ncbi:MAG: hypothetical protein ABFS35_22445 [Bacteroidota bacterium]
MRRINYLSGVLIGIVLLSCSSDENIIPDDENIVPDPPISQLIKVEQRSFTNGELNNTTIMNFINHKPVLWSSYDETNQLNYYQEWNYIDNEVLTSINTYLPDGHLEYEYTIFYDNENRFIQTIHKKNDIIMTTRNFIYNTDNTITSITNSGGGDSTKTFEINNNGIVDKEIVNGNVVVSVQYDNFKPIKKSFGSISYDYTYYENGLMPFTFASYFGINPVNVVLFNNSLDFASNSLTNELINEITNTNTTKKYIYTLNDNNFPSKFEYYYNGVKTLESDLFYE